MTRGLCVFQVLGRVQGYSRVRFERGGEGVEAYLSGDALCG